MSAATRQVQQLAADHVNAAVRESFNAFMAEACAADPHGKVVQHVNAWLAALNAELQWRSEYWDEQLAIDAEARRQARAHLQLVSSRE